MISFVSVSSSAQKNDIYLGYAIMVWYSRAVIDIDNLFSVCFGHVQFYDVSVGGLERILDLKTVICCVVQLNAMFEFSFHFFRFFVIMTLLCKILF